MVFADRAEAGRLLAERLVRIERPDAVVLGLPRGGVPVAYEVARALGVPLDVIVVRKVGVPFQPELAMGAVGEDGVRILNDTVVRMAGIDEATLAATESRERAHVEELAGRFRGGRPRLDLQGRIAIVIDDGIATGSTARAACQVARAHGAARVVLAVPVAPRSSVAELAAVADEVVCLDTPEPFFAVGQWYRNFGQTSDEEVMRLLQEAHEASAAAAKEAAVAPAGGPESADPPLATHRAPLRGEKVEVQAGHVNLAGDLTVPDDHQGLVVFAHGSGSSRHSPRNRFVAGILNEARFGTLLFDLLTMDEELDRDRVFDIELLAERLGAVTGWLGARPEARGVGLGYFGASTGAAAALCAAAGHASDVAAVVSRGGRPDLAGESLAKVRAPTLLIVGSRDEAVLELNRSAQARLRCESELSVVPGATHLFEEPGTLEQVAALAREWFRRYLPAGGRAGEGG